MYLTYLEYKDMGGTLEETAFNNYEYESERIVDFYTFNRFNDDEEFPDSLKRLMFKLISTAVEKQDAMSLGKSETGNQFIKRQSNDGVSTDYTTIDAAQLFTLLQELTPKYVKQYLQNTKNSKGQLVLYRGVYSNE